MKKSQEVSIASPEYRQFIEDLKTRVVSARISAARAVSLDLILLYWDIGRGIVEKQQVLGWDAVVKWLRQTYNAHFRNRSFSPANVWRMRQLHMVFSSEQFRAGCAKLENHTPRQVHHFRDKLSQKGKPCRRQPGGIQFSHKLCENWRRLSLGGIMSFFSAGLNLRQSCFTTCRPPPVSAGAATSS